MMFGVYRVLKNGSLRYVSRSATHSEKLAKEIARDLSDGVVILPTGAAKHVKPYPHIAKAIGEPAEKNPRKKSSRIAKNETLISERQALAVLMTQGDYSENQARAILAHSRVVSYDGGKYYPMGYIYKRAAGDTAKKNPRPEKRLTIVSGSYPQKIYANKRVAKGKRLAAKKPAWIKEDMKRRKAPKKSARKAAPRKRAAIYGKHYGLARALGSRPFVPAKKRRAAKRNPSPRWIIRADMWAKRTGQYGGKVLKKFYWTGELFDSDRQKAISFASLSGARERANLIAPKLPRGVHSLHAEQK